MVGADGALPLPWLAAPLAAALKQNAHALLVHGPEGVGQFELAVTLAQAWLCEARGGQGAHEPPCGVCAACRLVQARTHPDLLVLLPEALRERLGWSSDGEEAPAEKSSKAKPSKEIKVEAVRSAVTFAQTTSARARGKVVVLHPAERVNPIAANTLLKTLEEPAGDARFVLSGAAPDSLLPTIRSRCQSLAIAAPPTAEATAWLSAKGVAEPALMLAACGGHPLQALEWSEAGVEPRLWRQLPALARRGDAAPLLSWPLPRLVEALQKVCHDALCVACGSRPRYFPDLDAQRALGKADIGRLTAWARSLAQSASEAEHPWVPGLAVEALVDEARMALDSSAADTQTRGMPPLHSRA